MPAAETTPNTESLAGSIRALAVNDTISRTKRISLDEGCDISQELATLRNSVNQTVSRVRSKTGRLYRVESAPALTDDRNVVLCTVAVTRIATDSDEDVDI